MRKGFGYLLSFTAIIYRYIRLLLGCTPALTLIANRVVAQERNQKDTQDLTLTTEHKGII